MPKVFSVKELTYAIKDVIEGEFPFVWVKGQVGDVSLATSGHIYFVLKDEDTCLNIVWFKSNHFLHVNLPPKELESGIEIMCAGRIVVYPPKGSYQLIAEVVQRTGVGDLHLQFEAMKKKLQEKGFFDPSCKKTIPSSPSRVAVITAPTGAAIKDFLYIASKRGCGSTIRIYPSLVQGEEAPQSIQKAIEDANKDGWAEVLVLIRGGGSLEDLWAFNTEEVATAIFNSTIPVLTGIGHEIDTTIADLTADLRAATPSHAAQLLWPERHILIQQIDDVESSLLRVWNNFFQGKFKEFMNEKRLFLFFSPVSKLNRDLEELKKVTLRLQAVLNEFLKKKGFKLTSMATNFYNLFPHTSWINYKNQLFLLEHQMKINIESLLKKRERSLELFEKKIKVLDPYKPLERGYSLVYVESTNEILRTKHQVNKGDRVKIKTKSDIIRAEVLE